MLFWPESEGSISGRNNMGCQWQHSVPTLMELYYPPGTVTGTIYKHSSHFNSGLQVGSNWLKNHLGLYLTIYSHLGMQTATLSTPELPYLEQENCSSFSLVTHQVSIPLPKYFNKLTFSSGNEKGVRHGWFMYICWSWTNMIQTKQLCQRKVSVKLSKKLLAYQTTFKYSCHVAFRFMSNLENSLSTFSLGSGHRINDRLAEEGTTYIHPKHNSLKHGTEMCLSTAVASCGKWVGVQRPF